MKDLTNCLLFLLLVSFGEHIFLASMWRLKNEWPLAPPRAYFCHPQLIKKTYGESWHQTAFTKKNLRTFDEIKGIQAISILNGQNLPPPPLHVLGLNAKSMFKWKRKYIETFHNPSDHCVLLSFFACHCSTCHILLSREGEWMQNTIGGAWRISVMIIPSWFISSHWSLVTFSWCSIILPT